MKQYLMMNDAEIIYLVWLSFWQNDTLVILVTRIKLHGFSFVYTIATKLHLSLFNLCLRSNVNIYGVQFMFSFNADQNNFYYVWTSLSVWASPVSIKSMALI